MLRDNKILPMNGELVCPGNALLLDAIHAEAVLGSGVQRGKSSRDGGTSAPWLQWHPMHKLATGLWVHNFRSMQNVSNEELTAIMLALVHWAATASTRSMAEVARKMEGLPWMHTSGKPPGNLSLHVAVSCKFVVRRFLEKWLAQFTRRQPAPPLVSLSWTPDADFSPHPVAAKPEYSMCSIVASAQARRSARCI